MRTLSRPLLLGLLLVAVMTGLLSAWASWRAARTEVDELLDGDLATSVRGLEVLSRSQLHGPGAALDLPHELPVWQGEMGALGAAPEGAGGHAYERHRLFHVWRGDVLLLHTAGAPQLDPARVGEGFQWIEFEGSTWRSFSLRGRDGLRYVGLEPLALREHITARIANGLLWPLLLELPLLALLIWVVVRAGSRSLRRVARAVSSQASDRLQPIERARVPAEIHGLVDAINGLLARTEETLRRERRFIDEAAHELRTPVAALRLHLSNLVGAEDEFGRTHALGQLQRSQARLERSVAQLLTLSRLGPDAPVAADALTDLSALLPGWLAEWIDAGLAGDDELELQAAPGLRVRADSDAVATVLRNLVDNALRHGGRPARVRIEAWAEGSAVFLAVEDSGPGLDPEERERVLDPFYRPPGTRAEGSGLGLSIVARIAQLAGGEVRLLEGRDGRGLRVEVRFPAA